MNPIWLRFLPDFIKEKIEGRQGLQKAIANTGWLFADKIIRMGVGLFVGVWIARYLGPQQFGLLSYATAFVALFGTVASLGLDGIVVRDIVRYPDSKDEILGTSFWLRCAGGVATLIFAMVCSVAARPADRLTHWLVLIIATGNVFQSFDVIDYWFQSQVQSRYTVVVKNAAFLATAVLKIVLLVRQASLVAFAVAGLIEIVLGSAGLLIAFKKQGQRLRSWVASLAWTGRLLRDSWPLILSGMVIAVYMRIDQIMLGDMLGNEAVGIYSTAVRISEIWYIIPSTIVVSVFPAIIMAKQENADLYIQRIQYLYTLLTWMALAVAVPLTFLSTPAVTTLFGRQYAPAGVVLSIHIWTALFTFFGIGKSVYIQVENMQRFSLVCTGTGAIVNVLLNLVLIKKYGAVGAAIATLCAQMTSAVIIPMMYPRDRISVRLFVKSFYHIFEMSELWGGIKRHEKYQR